MNKQTGIRISDLKNIKIEEDAVESFAERPMPVPPVFAAPVLPPNVYRGYGPARPGDQLPSGIYDAIITDIRDSNRAKDGTQGFRVILEAESGSLMGLTVSFMIWVTGYTRRWITPWIKAFDGNPNFLNHGDLIGKSGEIQVNWNYHFKYGFRPTVYVRDYSNRWIGPDIPD